ncbi:LOW QUALITY PROTEIN: kinesin-like protein KIF14 [Procambarus clarkii]|uniref:LOW QUALITY PROTEIN: kinesin-like protein KIF14 n=1 Tax=Procambarus clarkii TaxID=6728 RepID=UPI003742C86B
MSKFKTDVKVVFSSHSEKRDPVNKQAVKENKKKTRTPLHTQSSNPLQEMDSARLLKTPSNMANTAPAITPRTPMSATSFVPRGVKAHSSNTAPTTPRTPATSTLHPSDIRGTTPCHVPSPLCSAKGVTLRANRTHLQPSVSRTPGTNTPSVPPVSSCAGSKTSKNMRDAEGGKKDDDGRSKDHLNRASSSTMLTVPTSTRRSRVSCTRLSGESKTPTQAKSSGRSSASFKLTVGSNTPTPGSSRRSSSSHGRLTNTAQPPAGVIQLTPDVVSRYPVKLSTSPHEKNCYGGAESTTVSVGVRVRPISTREQSTPDVRNIVDVVGNSIKVTSDSGTVHTFSYDHCFNSSGVLHPHNASQEDVYVTLAKPLLEKAYEGYNTCLFAYGQTGSGKSYTMLGDDSYSESELEVPTAAGIIPRFCRDLLHHADYLHSLNPPESQLPQCRVEVEISYIEIYNERIYDLLASGGSGTECREALRVREHPNDGPYVEGVARHLVSTYDHFQTWLLLGNKERSIAATGVNEKSSRSHAVFTIKLTQIQVEDVEGEQLESSKVSIINLVDLAGSERVAAAQSQGERLKEGVFINKSLLTLGKVITALSESEGRRRQFIPYRESVLTYLLKESLGGNSRTAMIATVSPCNIYLEETLSTLRYAQQASKIVNHNYINEDPTAVIIRSLKDEVERLRLQQLRRSSSQLFDGEVMGDEEISDQEGGTDDKEKDLLERENAVNQKEMESNQAIQEKEEEIAGLREQLRCTQLHCQHVLSEKNRNLEQRLQAAEAQRQQALESLRRLGIASEKETGPMLINLSEDPQLSETLSYRLKNGTTSLGHSSCDLTLRGLHADNIHCSILNEDGNLQLLPKMDTDTYINGKLVTSPQNLQHNDRLVLAGIYYFRVSNQVNSKNSSRETSKKMDFYFTKEELLKEQEIRLQKEAEMALAASKAEMEREMRYQKDRLMQDILDAQNRLMNKQQLVSEMEGTQFKLEAEKRLLEEKVLREKEEGQLFDMSLQSTGLPPSNFVLEMQTAFNESMQEVRRESIGHSSHLLSLSIKEARQICTKLKKPYEFTLHEVFNDFGLEEVVLVKDLQHHMTATLTIPTFKEKLQTLRDIVQGEEYDEIFEASLQWERSEDVTFAPGFINRLLECPSLQALNSSLNCSLNASSSFLTRSNTNRRRSNMLYGAERSLSISEYSACRGSVTVAGAIHWALTSLPMSDPVSPPLSTALNTVADLHEVIQHIRDHITEPGHTLSDEDLTKRFIHLYHSSQATINSLLAVANIENLTNCAEGVQLQEKLRRMSSKIASCTSRFFQGAKNEVDSLLEEESCILASLTQALVADIAKLALFASVPVPTSTKLKPGGLLCKKFTDGLKKGLDLLVINSGKTASNSTDLLSSPCCGERVSSQDSDALSAAAHSATAGIAAFLKKFEKLSASLEYDESLLEEEKTYKIVRWVNCIELTSDTLTQLTAAILAVVNQVTLSQQGKLNTREFECTIDELKTRLQYLMDFAGLNLTSADGPGSSLASSSKMENSKEFMDNLRTVAWHSLHEVENLKNYLCSSKRSLKLKESKGNAFKCNKILVAEWPRNSQEYQQHLKRLEEQKHRMKNTPYYFEIASSEQKRVRFDISSSSISSVGGFEENDNVNV